LWLHTIRPSTLSFCTTYQRRLYLGHCSWRRSKHIKAAATEICRHLVLLWLDETLTVETRRARKPKSQQRRRPLRLFELVSLADDGGIAFEGCSGDAVSLVAGNEYMTVLCFMLPLVIAEFHSYRRIKSVRFPQRYFVRLVRSRSWFLTANASATLSMCQRLDSVGKS
jgi:hypothetical protein